MDNRFEFFTYKFDATSNFSYRFVVNMLDQKMKSEENWNSFCAVA